MKALQRFVEKTKPDFEEGGKHHKWLSIYESFETFFFVLKNPTRKGAHIRDAMDMKRTMSVVILALIPALLFGIWNVGNFHYQAIGNAEVSMLEMFWFGFLKVLPIIVVSYAAGLGVEFIFVYLRGHEINEGFLVSGLLIPLIVPVDIPLWMVAVATAIAVLVGKEAFGGTGMNVLNPALLTRAILFFAYPSQMSGDTIWIQGLTKGTGIVDGFSGATPMAQAAAATSKEDVLNLSYSPADMFFGLIPGSIGETSFLAILIGAAVLIYTGVGSWKIITSVFAGGLLMGLLLNNLAGDSSNYYLHLPAYQHLLLGGFAFGAVFMATDPVTAAQTERGKWLYGFLIGVLAILIRVLNPAYPEGVMLAILLMNVFAPLIDHNVIQANIKRRLKRVPVN